MNRIQAEKWATFRLVSISEWGHNQGYGEYSAAFCILFDR